MPDPKQPPGPPGPAAEQIHPPPRTLGQTLRRLGPGIIIAGSIVGSGELIATTSVGAEAGFFLLWLVVIGCVIKVFTQVELGRYTVTHRRTTLQALDEVPGPRLRVNWLLWYWVIMTALIITQQGGIVGGVGQALAISFPVTEAGVEYNQMQNDLVEAKVRLAVLRTRQPGSEEVEPLERRVRLLESIRTRGSHDAYLWAAAIAMVTSIVLYFGRYGLIQSFSLVLVVSFTLITVLTVILLQTQQGWAVQPHELTQGLGFRLPPPTDRFAANPMATALGAFGIIGVGAGELLMYPYWCLEKGYARYTGPYEDTPQWIDRARGWLRVLKIDAWLSMVVYTFATVAFYLLGAAVLWRSGLNPAGQDMVRFLAEMYVPVFGSWAQPVFLFGAFAVLYSTFFVVAAGFGRLVADGMGLFGLHDGSEATRMRWTRIISVIWPLLAAALFIGIGILRQGQSPRAMVIASGIAQAIMLPMLGLAALYFRYKRCHKALAPGKLWDAMLWLSFIGFLIAGLWIIYDRLAPLVFGASGG